MMAFIDKHPDLVYLPQVIYALQHHLPVVALESTVITHGLPIPQNLELARQLEAEVRNHGAQPATVAILAGKIHIGLDDASLETLALGNVPVRKVSKRDFGITLAKGEYGGTTVAGTLVACKLSGIKTFATGGIGGVHRDAPFDISADLQELAQSPVIVVCAGAKAILDLPATLEYLETMGVPVIGYRTDEFPAFYATSSGLPVPARADSPEEIAAIANAQWSLGLSNAVLVAVPPPPESAVPSEQIENYICQAIEEARSQAVHGALLTPFLLKRVSQLSGGISLKANLALLRQNAALAAEIATALNKGKGGLAI
jgi:pseudouridine-5'-phosphate glycosidase